MFLAFPERALVPAWHDRPEAIAAGPGRSSRPAARDAAGVAWNTLVAATGRRDRLTTHPYLLRSELSRTDTIAT